MASIVTAGVLLFMTGMLAKRVRMETHEGALTGSPDDAPQGIFRAQRVAVQVPTYARAAQPQADG